MSEEGELGYRMGEKPPHYYHAGLPSSCFKSSYGHPELLQVMKRLCKIKIKVINEFPTPGKLLLSSFSIYAVLK